MNSEIKYLLKGKFEFNIKDNSLYCRNKTGLTYIIENKDNIFFQEVLSRLNRNGKANPHMEIEYEKPRIPIPLELFHRVLRSNELLYNQSIGIKETRSGLFCFSENIKNFQINHHRYPRKKEVYIDPQRMCKITRRIRDRERIDSKILIEEDRIILECVFPWCVLTVIMPTLQTQ